LRFLLLHPEDSPFDNRWSTSRWDLIIDLGWAGRCQYREWQRQLGFSVKSLFDLADWWEDVRRIRQLFAIGSGRLVDSEGIDWWDLLTPIHYRRVFELFLLQKLAREVGPASELYVSRRHALADFAGHVLGEKAIAMSVTPHRGLRNRIRRYGTALRTLTPRQIAMIAGDKWDTDYRLRRVFTPRYKSNSRPKILLPSAYRNVSRIAVSYAKLLPDDDFLLVTTRADGALVDLPGHVQAAPLAAFVPGPGNGETEREIASLIARWQALENDLLLAEDPVLVHTAGLRVNFPQMLRRGLRIRDAWREVFERESITAVLCGDEGNIYTRLPVLLANKRSVRTIHCSHGALDATLWTAGTCSDIYLVKGEMEKDYTVTQCRVPEQKVVLGAPIHYRPSFDSTLTSSGDNNIFFFSEPYELGYGRTEPFYRELLGNLCQVARKHGRKLILKLHPFESAKARSDTIDRVLDGNDRELVEISTETVTEQLLQRIWFGITVESSTAVECALAGKPSFLCGWFDSGLQAYGKQYEKFGAAKRLLSPAEVLQIPEMLGSWPSRETVDRLYHPIAREELAELLKRPAVARV
jgi:hypothetical protein